MVVMQKLARTLSAATKPRKSINDKSINDRFMSAVPIVRNSALPAVQSTLDHHQLITPAIRMRT